MTKEIQDLLQDLLERKAKAEQELKELERILIYKTQTIGIMEQRLNLKGQ